MKSSGATAGKRFSAGEPAMPWRWLCGAVISLALLASSAPAQQQEEHNLHCLLELELPRFAAAPIVREGTVEAVVAIGWKGEPTDIEYQASHRLLQLEVSAHLRQLAKYDPQCAGKEVKLRFTFKLEGEETHYPYPITRFRPPNHFIIITQPPKPIIEAPWPVEPRKPEAKGRPEAKKPEPKDKR